VTLLCREPVPSRRLGVVHRQIFSLKPGK
jgi:hypothetical protein